MGFEATEHAGYAHEGSDIVCSAVSALTITAVNGMTEYLKLPVGVESGDGYLYCELGADVSEADWQRAEILLETMILGLKAIARDYGDYLSTTEREV